MPVRPTCAWYDDSYDDFLDPASMPEGCSEVATHRSCVPYIDAPTCAKHKCRCAKPLELPRPNEPWAPAVGDRVVIQSGAGGVITTRGDAQSWVRFDGGLNQLVWHRDLKPENMPRPPEAKQDTVGDAIIRGLSRLLPEQQTPEARPTDLAYYRDIAARMNRDEPVDPGIAAIAIEWLADHLEAARALAPRPDKPLPEAPDYGEMTDAECCATGYHRRRDEGPCACGYKGGTRPLATHARTAGAYLERWGLACEDAIVGGPSKAMVDLANLLAKCSETAKPAIAKGARVRHRKSGQAATVLRVMAEVRVDGVLPDDSFHWNADNLDVLDEKGEGSEK